MMFRFVRGIFGSALSQLMQQFTVIQDQAINPLKVIQDQLEGVWRGQSANSFNEALSNIAIPGIGQVGTNITTLSTNLRRAEEIMDQADEAVDRIVKSGLDDIFNFF